MKTFLAIYKGTPAARKASGWDELSEAERKSREQKGMAEWGGWMQKNAAALVHAGGPLGKTKRASKRGVEDFSNDLVGYVVFRAESHEAAAKLFENHPHFSVFPGEAVEIMPEMPIPG